MLGTGGNFVVNIVNETSMRGTFFGKYLNILHAHYNYGI